MRFFSLITALLVMASLYLLVFQREALLAFAAGGDTPVEEAQDGDAVDPASIVSVVAVHSEAQAIERVVLVRGRTEAARQVDVRAETSGQVISDPLRKGAFVDEGALLCRIDPGTREVSLNETTARLGEAVSRLPEAEARLAEARAAYLAAEARISEAKAKVPEAEARLAEAKAGVTTAEARLAEALTSVPTAEARLSEAMAGVPTAEARLAEALAGVPTAEARLAEAMAAVPTAEARLAEAEASVPTAEARLAEAEASVPTAEARLREALASVPTAEARLEEAEAAVPAAEASVTEARARLPEGEARLVEARAKVSEAELNLNAAEKLAEGGFASETRVKATIAAAELARAGVQAALSQLEGAKAGVEAALSRLSGTKAGLQAARGQVESAKAAVQSAKGQVESAKASVQSAKGQVESAKAQIQSAKGQVESAKAQIQSAKGQVESAKAQIQSAKGQVENAKTQIESAKGQVESAKAQIQSAKGQVEGAHAAVQSAISLVESARVGVISAESGLEGARAAVQSATSGVEGAGAAIKSAEAGVAGAEKEIERLEIHAPFAGLLELDAAELGSLLQPGSLCATIIQLDPIKLVGFVPESDVDRVTLGALAGARLATGREAHGKVTFLSRSADETTRTFRVEVQVPNGDLAIRDGQTVEIVIQSEGQDAHLIPQSALTLDDDGRLGVRIVDPQSEAAFFPVTVLRDATDGIYVAGLPASADVIVVGQEFVTDGVPVAASFREAPPMTGIVDWAGGRARMVIAFVILSLLAGGFAYMGLPKEGEPDIEIPALFVSVPFNGISAEDSETLLVKPMETELSDLDGLKTMTGTASEGYAGVAMEFEFGWDKTKIIADVRDRMNKAEANFPAGADQYSINEINFSEFPIVIVNLTGAVPERTLLRVAKDLQDRLEGLEPVLEAALAGHRDEMVEVVIDPLRLEAYNVTAGELINVVVNNNQLIAAGEVETSTGAFSVKIPSSFDDQRDVYNLPVKVNGDRVVTLGELADIRLTFEDRAGTARYNGETTVALQVVKRKGFNLIDTAALVREEVAAERETWPPELKATVNVGTSNDQSFTVASMVSQLEGSVLTAIALVMIVVLAALGTRSALLVGFAIPTSFLLCFAFLAVMGVSVSNIVMFGLILAVGMLVDGAIVVVEYADRRIREGSGPMRAYIEAAKRMFWPIVSSTATTLCAFLPMLFWPGVPGEFMGMLPVTLIFVLSASLLVALVYLPVMGGVAGRMSRSFEHSSDALRRAVPWWFLRALLVPPSAYLVFIGAMQVLNPHYIFAPMGLPQSPMPPALIWLPGAVLFLGGAILTSITLGAAQIHRKPKKVTSGHRRTPFGWLIKLIAGNPIMPLVTIAAVIGLVMSVFTYFGANNYGVEFFVESEPEQAIVYVRARGNLSLAEKDAMVDDVERVILATPGVDSAFAFAGAGGLNQNTGGAQGPLDTVGQVQIELVRWEDRPRVETTTRYFYDLIPFTTSEVDPVFDGDVVLERLETELAKIPGIRTEILNLSRGPASGKPVHLRLKGENWDQLLAATATVRAKFENTEALIDIEDTRPLPGIDWQIDVDVEKAGRFGADVATVGGMVQLVTRGILLDTMRVDSSDEEIEIRVRLPEQDRVLSTLDSLKVRTQDGLVPLSNFISRKPVAKLGQIDRVDQKRYFDVKADAAPGLTKEVVGEDGETRTVPINPNERIAVLTEWLETENALPPGVEWEWTGDQEEQAESQAFLMTAFAGALGLMFIILLAQFNSFYNAVLVLLAVVLSTAGVLVGMLVMQQPFSIIMTGTGIVALAGIVVNNNIVLIDTYQEYSKYMPRIEAIIRTAEARIRPVLLTTITTMAGLTPMMFGLSLDFIGGGYSVNSPTSLWWKQLATAVVFGLGTATVLTLVFTPSMLAVRVWATTYVLALARLMARLSMGRSSRAARDFALKRAARRVKAPEIIWDVEIPVEDEVIEEEAEATPEDEALIRMLSLRAAE